MSKTQKTTQLPTEQINTQTYFSKRNLDPKYPYGYHDHRDLSQPNNKKRLSRYERELDQYYSQYNLPGLAVTPRKCELCNKQMTCVRSGGQLEWRCLTPKRRDEEGKIIPACKTTVRYKPLNSFCIRCLEIPTYRLDGSIIPVNNHAKAVTVFAQFKIGLKLRPELDKLNHGAPINHLALYGDTPKFVEQPTKKGYTVAYKECPTCRAVIVLSKPDRDGFEAGNVCTCEPEDHANHARGFQAKSLPDYKQFDSRAELDAYTDRPPVIPEANPNYNDDFTQQIRSASNWDLALSPTDSLHRPPSPSQKLQPVTVQQTSDSYNYTVPLGGNKIIAKHILKHSKAQPGDRITVIIKTVKTIGYLPETKTPEPRKAHSTPSSIIPFIHSSQRHGL